MLAVGAAVVWFAGFAFLAMVAFSGSRWPNAADLLMIVFWPAVMVGFVAIMFVDQIRHILWVRRNRDLIARDFGDVFED